MYHLRYLVLDLTLCWRRPVCYHGCHAPVHTSLMNSLVTKYTLSTQLQTTMCRLVCEYKAYVGVDQVSKYLLSTYCVLSNKLWLR